MTHKKFFSNYFLITILISSSIYFLWSIKLLNDFPWRYVFTDWIINYEGGYITATKITKKEIEKSGGERQCVIDAQITVDRFKGKPDPNFALSAELSDKKMFANETFFITGEITKEAYVYLLGYLPMKDVFYKIIPNPFEPMSKIQGEFIFPSKNSSSKYALEALLPKDFENDQLSEIMLVLATKDEFNLLNTETAPNFYKRLNELGRDRWRKINLGYTIVRK